VGSPWVTFVVLVGSLGLFHLVLLRRPRPRAFWLAVDYAWFASIALGLIGTTVSARRLLVDGDTDRQSQQVEYLWRLAGDEAHDQANFCYVQAERLRDRGRPGADHLDAAGNWFNDLSRVLATGARAPDWRRFVTATPPADESALPADVVRARQDIQVHLRRLDNEERALAELERVASTGDAERAVMLVLPWVVAVAVALRVTRVTAEVRDALRAAG
jgi:hypothetical protein